MQEKARIFKSRLCYLRFLIHFSIQKKWRCLCLRIPVLQSKQVVLIRSTQTYLRCIADQTGSKYDQPTLYPDHHAVPPLNIRPVESGIIPDHFSTGWKNYPANQDLSERARPLPRCILNQHMLSSIKSRSLPIRPFFQSARERGLIGSLVWTGF